MGRSMPWRIVAAAWILAAMLVPVVPTGSKVAAEAPPPPALDLAWVVPAPREVPEAGFGIVLGSHYESAADAGVRDTGPDASEDDHAALQGFVQSYFARVAAPKDEDADYYRRSVNTRVTQFRDAPSARAGFAVQQAFLQSQGGAMLSLKPELGEESAAFRVAGVGGSSTRYQSVGVMALVPPLVVTVQVLDYTGDNPPASLAEAIAAPAVARAGAVLERPAPGPSRRIARYGTMSREEYRRRDGEQLPLYLTPAADLASDDAVNDRDGVVSSYYFLSTVNHEGKPDVAWNGAIWPMQSEGLARGYAERAYAGWLSAPPPGVIDVEAVPLADPDDPRRVVAFTWLAPGSTVIKRGYRAWFAQGTAAAFVESFADPGIRFAAFELASGQAVDCLTDGCPNQLYLAPNLAAASVDEANPPAAAIAGNPAAAPTGEPAPLLDLAWIAPRPGDAAGAGYRQIRGSGWMPAHAQFEWMVDGKPSAAALFAAETMGAGWRQGWSGSRATPLPDDPDWFARRFHVDLAQTVSADGAAELALALSLFALPAVGMLPVDSPPAGVPGAGYFRQHGKLGDGTPLNMAAAVIHDGDVVLVATLADFTGDVPAFSELAALTDPALARLAAARAGTPAGLAMRAPRYAWPEMDPSNLEYLLTDGVVQGRYGESDADLASGGDWLASQGVLEAALGSTKLPANRKTDADLGLWQTLTRFADAAAADAYIDHDAGNVSSGDVPGQTSIEVVSGIPAGDRTVLVTYLTTDGPNRPFWQAADIWVRVGPMVNRVGVTAPAALPREDLEALARRAAECLATAACATFEDLPASLLADPDPVIRVPGERLKPTA